MRKELFLLSALLFSTAVFAQSTCQTRVDAHQKATTPQRVEYCLTQDAYPATTVSQPELVYAQVSSHQPAAEPQQKEYTSSNPYFNEDKYTVMRGYVGTTQFPEFQNATMSEQEMAAYRKAWLEREAALNQAAHPIPPQQPVYTTTATVTYPTLTKPAVTKPAVSVVETKAGLSRRSAKPQRVMKQAGLVTKETVTVKETPSTETDLSQTTAPTEETTVTTVQQQSSTQPSADELGLLPDNPYAQPADLTTADETIPYGEK